MIEVGFERYRRSVAGLREWKDTEMFKSNRWTRLALKAALAMPLSASAAQEPASTVSEQEVADLVRKTEARAAPSTSW